MKVSLRRRRNYGRVTSLGLAMLGVLLIAVSASAQQAIKLNRPNIGRPPVLIPIESGSGTGPNSQAIPLVAPIPPLVPPIIAANYPEDSDGDAIGDSLNFQLDYAHLMLQEATTPQSESQALATLDEDVNVELVFSRQINQAQINAFLGLGGEIRYIYKAVSYGWYGTIPLSQVENLPPTLGASLVLVEELLAAAPTLRLATQTGRVRPVWAAGFAGGAGYDGDPTIRIAIIDTGVDGGHTDMTGREAFWFDYTTDMEPTSRDIIGHGSHVASIAVGSGASLGVGTTLNFTQDGDLTGVPNGSFFPNEFDFPSPTTDWTVIAHWIQGNGPPSTNLFGGHTPKGSLSFAADFGGKVNTGQGWLASGFAMSSANSYTPILTSNSRIQNFVTLNTLTNYSAVGDGFNTLRGVAPGSHWVGAKVFTNAGAGDSGTIGSAIDDMVVKRITHNIKIMNLSIGFNGNPGIETTTRQKLNTAAMNGILPVTSAGNDGPTGTATGEIDDPSRAAMALTVGATNDLNEVTDYTSHGFATPGSTAGLEEDFKPDLLAPGGSIFYSMIMAMDTNDADAPNSTTFLTDFVADDYLNIMGTSMASPFAAGCAALVIDALQSTGNLNGASWDFTSSNDVRRVKMLMTATATETNAAREAGTGTTPGTDPTLQRATGGPLGFPAGKDPYEGYGILNVDAAIEGGTLSYVIGDASMETFGSGTFDRRAWARNISMTASVGFNLDLTVPGGGDYDMYLYSFAPSAFGTPVMLASSTNAGDGVMETISHTPGSTELGLLVIKRVSGLGQFSLGSELQDFNFPPHEYTYVLQMNGDIEVTDTVLARDGVNTILSGTSTVKFASVDYNLVPGTNGADSITGTTGVDLILGFSGNDWMDGDDGNDTLIGGSGNDIIWTGDGSNTVRCGDGTDKVVLEFPDATDDVDGGAGSGDLLQLTTAYASFSMTGSAGFEIFFGGVGDDIIDWSDATVNLTMKGKAGNDTLTGGSGNDSLLGDIGNDVLTGNGGADVLKAGTGSDSAFGGAGRDTVQIDPDGVDTFNGGDGTKDTLVFIGSYVSVTLVGSNGFERFTGADGIDNIDWSDATNPVLMKGKGGNDTFIGGSARDRFEGGDGDDHFTGNGGNDWHFGGAGTDTSHFTEDPDTSPDYLIIDQGTRWIVQDNVSDRDGRDKVWKDVEVLSN